MAASPVGKVESLLDARLSTQRTTEVIGLYASAAAWRRKATSAAARSVQCSSKGLREAAEGTAGPGPIAVGPELNAFVSACRGNKIKTTKYPKAGD